MIFTLKQILALAKKGGRVRIKCGAVCQIQAGTRPIYWEEDGIAFVDCVSEHWSEVYFPLRELVDDGNSQNEVVEILAPSKDKDAEWLRKIAASQEIPVSSNYTMRRLRKIAKRLENP